MAVDASKIHIALTGKVFSAPLATVAPVDVTTPWGTGWTELGYTTEDGVKMKSTTQVQERKPWQSIWTVKRWVEGRSFEIDFTTWEWKGSTLQMAFGGGTFATAGTGPTLVNTYTTPNDATLYELSMGVEWSDGDSHTTRMVIPKGMVTSPVDSTIGRKELVQLPVIFSATATGVGPTVYWMSNDPALVATV